MTEVTLRPSTPAPADGSAPPSTRQTGAASPADRPREGVETAYEDVVARLPFPPPSLARLLGPRTATQEKLDAFMNSAEGPYRAEGRSVRVPTQFRMRGGFNDPGVVVRGEPAWELPARRARAADRDAIAAGSGLTASNALVRIGRGSPADVTRITQALIDANKLEPGSPESLPRRIHDLQWRYGVGLDCAGYVRGALLAVYGGPASRLGLASPDLENFSRLASKAAFRAVPPDRALPGDVMVLRGSGREPGHNLIVYSHELVDTAVRVRLLATWPDARPFFRTSVRIHVLEVDASFGAGTHGSASGGVRRDTLLFDEASGQWCTCRSTTPPTAVVCVVPYDESSLAGIFRVKG
jgi:hypothetical protein